MFKAQTAKVDQQCDLAPCSCEVRNGLFLMKCSQLRQCFCFYNDSILDQEIKIKKSYGNIVVEYLDGFLALKVQALFFHLHRQGLLVEFLREAWPKCIVHGDCGSD